MTQGHEPAGYQASRRARERARLAWARGSRDCITGVKKSGRRDAKSARMRGAPGAELGGGEHGVLGADGVFVRVIGIVVGGQDGEVGVAHHGGIGINRRGGAVTGFEDEGAQGGEGGGGRGGGPLPIQRSVARNRLASAPRRHRAATRRVRRRRDWGRGGAARRRWRARHRGGRGCDSGGPGRSTGARARRARHRRAWRRAAARGRLQRARRGVTTSS